MLAALALGALLLQEPAATPADRVASVEVSLVGSRQAVTVVLPRADVAAAVRREGDRVTIDVAAGIGPELARPVASGLVRRAVLEPVGSSSARIVLEVAEGASHEVVRREERLIVLLGRSGEQVPVGDVYGLLFPETVEGADPNAPLQQPQDEALIGSGSFDPSLAVLYTTGRGSFAGGTLEPQEDSLFEIRPRIDTGLGVGLLDLRPSYEARIRRGSRFESSNDTSHLANLGATMPIGPALQLTGNYEFVRGRAEATEADPGGEFFYGKDRFTHHNASLDAAWELGALTRVFVSGTHRRLDLDNRQAFVSHRANTISGGLRRDVGPRLVADLRYSHEWIPAPVDRSLVEARTDTLSANLRGDITPRLTGLASVGYARRTSPQAPEPARERSDVVASVSLRQELTPSMNVLLNLGRSQNVSAFEANPFYVSETASIDVTVPVPLSFILTGAAGYHRNSYPVQSSSIGAPRRDRITSWGVGLARPLGGWGYLRLDYQESSRKSNISGFSFDTAGFTAQVVLRPFHEEEGRRR